MDGVLEAQVPVRTTSVLCIPETLKVCDTPIASAAASPEAVKEVEYMSPLAYENASSEPENSEETTVCFDEKLTFSSPTTPEVEKEERAVEPTDLLNTVESLDTPIVIGLLIIPLFDTDECAIVIPLDKVDTVWPPLNDLLSGTDNPALCSGLMELITEDSAETTMCEAKVGKSEDEEEEGEITLLVALWG